MELKRKELGFLYFKPNDEPELDLIVIEETRKMLESFGLEVLYSKEVVMTEELLKKHHPDLFIIEPGYSEEEEKWKKPTIERALAFNKNLTFLVSGENCLSQLKVIKSTIRGKYAKQGSWQDGVSQPNCIHTSSTPEELRRDIEALMPEKIPLLDMIDRIRRGKESGKGLDSR